MQTPVTPCGGCASAKPLVHQITNYVVMNETANATLALGALPVMAHAREEVEEMVGARGRARPQHRHALARLGRGDAAAPAGRRTRAACRSCSTRSAPARRRTAPRRRSGSSTRSTSPCCAATRARWRRSSESRPRCAGVESIGAGDDPAELAREAARTLGRRRVGDRARRPRLRRRAGRGDRERRPDARVDHRHRLHVERDHRLLPRRRRTRRSTAAVEALVAFGVAGEDAAREREGAGLVPRRRSTTRSPRSTRRRSTRGRASS